MDEQKDEQGIAHLVEHVTFLGSSKREGLLGTGARSNAYTDFHHTVFHVHAPLVNSSGFGKPTPMLPQVQLRRCHESLARRGGLSLAAILCKNCWLPGSLEPNQAAAKISAIDAAQLSSQLMLGIRSRLACIRAAL